MGEWLYYNFAAGSFHTKKLSTEKQTKNRFSSYPWGVRATYALYP